MTPSFALIPGAGGQGWYWHRVVEELERRGHEAIAIDLPASDDRVGLDGYVDLAAAAIGDRRAVVVVGQSMGGLTAPLVCRRVDAIALVLVNAMIPMPCETGADWWSNTGAPEARRRDAAAHGRPVGDDMDVEDEFFHDVPAHLTAEAMAIGDPPQSSTPFATPWPIDGWPGVPITVVAGRDDRFFPIAFQRDLARRRLGLEVVEVPGGHLVALSQPVALCDAIVGAIS